MQGCRHLYLRSRQLRQRGRRQRQTIERQNKVITQLKLDLKAATKHPHKRGKIGRYFSAAGGLMMACKQAGSLASSTGIGLTLGTDVHASTVSAWQVRLRAAQLLKHKKWLLEKREEARYVEPWQEKAFRFQLHRYRADASNGREKIHVTELSSTFITCDVYHDTPWHVIRAHTETRTIMCELRKDPPSCWPGTEADHNLASARAQPDYDHRAGRPIIAHGAQPG